MAEDYYDTLEVSSDVDDKDLKKAFRKLAMQYHPDRNPGDAAAEQKFKQVSEAYDVLSDPQKRSTYDRFGHDGLKGAGFNPGFSNAEDIFSQFSDIFGDLFGGRGGGFSAGGRPRGPRRGADLEFPMKLDFLDAVTGGERTIEVPRHHHCDTCGGSGAKPGTSPVTCNTCGGRGEVIQQQMFLRVRTTCPACSGHGKVIGDRCIGCSGTGRSRKVSKLSVKIPPGVDHGMQLRLGGEGEFGDPGGTPGDLYVTIYLKPHEFFQRDGLDVYCTVPVSYAKVCLGASITVPTVHGKAQLVIPSGTPSGKVFVIRGEGIPSPTRSKQRGSQHTQVVVEVPKRMTSAEKALVQKLSELEQGQKSGATKKGFWRDFMEGLGD